MFRNKVLTCVEIAAEVKKQLSMMNNKQGYALKNWVEGLSDEAFYPWESPKKIGLKSVNTTFASEQKKVLIH